ncbi:MAG: pantoate--beta-alanine ligase [Rickettsiales bacterium]|nr:pantoate--beta-alanine ligase [Rickettsiales bacterium]
MKIIRNIQEWINIRRNISFKAQIGFVPTMGCLHKGHLSLIKKSIARNDINIVSIFVNPIQFNDQKDYESYPRILDKDIELLKNLKVDFVFIPLEKELYLNNQFNIVSDHPLSKILEGKFRRGHFNGMLTIVLKLLLLTKPNNAYFGEKDYQQYVLIKEMAKHYFIDTKIIVCSTIRDKYKLPKSSRNNNLSNAEIKTARRFAQVFHNNIKMNIEEMQSKLFDAGIDIEYLQKVHNRIFIAVKIGHTRLIDNVIIEA